MDQDRQDHQRNGAQPFPEEGGFPLLGGGRINAEVFLEPGETFWQMGLRGRLPMEMVGDWVEAFCNATAYKAHDTGFSLMTRLAFSAGEDGLARAEALFAMQGKTPEDVLRSQEQHQRGLAGFLQRRLHRQDAEVRGA